MRLAFTTKLVIALGLVFFIFYFDLVYFSSMGRVSYSNDKKYSIDVMVMSYKVFFKEHWYYEIWVRECKLDKRRQKIKKIKIFPSEDYAGEKPYIRDKSDIISWEKRSYDAQVKLENTIIKFSINSKNHNAKSIVHTHLSCYEPN